MNNSELKPVANERREIKCFSVISELIDSVLATKESILNLELIKNRSIIHLKQFQHDYDELKTMYDKLRSMMSIPPESEQPEGINPIIDKQANDQSKKQRVSKEKKKSEGLRYVTKMLKWHVDPNPKHFDPTKFRLRYSIETGYLLLSVQFGPTGKQFVFSDGRMLHILDFLTAKEIFNVDLPNSVEKTELHTRTIRYSPDGNYIACTVMESKILIVSTVYQKQMTIFDGHNKIVSALLFLPNSNTLFSGGFDGILCQWNIQTQQMERKIAHANQPSKEYHKSTAIVSLTTDSSGDNLIVGFLDGHIGIYDIQFQNPMCTIIAHNDNLMKTVGSKKSSQIVTVSQDKTAKLWNIHGLFSCKQIFERHTDSVLTAVFSPVDDIVFTGSKDETIKAWDSKTGTLLFTLFGHMNSVFELDHHPTQRTFISCSADSYIAVWDYGADEA